MFPDSVAASLFDLFLFLPSSCIDGLHEVAAKAMLGPTQAPLLAQGL
jgi:hypothetical protein